LAVVFITFRAHFTLSNKRCHDVVFGLAATAKGGGYSESREVSIPPTGDSGARVTVSHAQLTATRSAVVSIRQIEPDGWHGFEGVSMHGC
jgi:hypothetical protein